MMTLEVNWATVKEILVPDATDVLRVLESDFSERSYEARYVSQVGLGDMEQKS